MPAARTHSRRLHGGRPAAARVKNFMVKSAEDPILPDALIIIDTGTPGQGKDKPWIAADVGRARGTPARPASCSRGPRPPRTSRTPRRRCRVQRLCLLRQFHGQTATTRIRTSTSRCRRDCGKTFGKPNKISQGGTTSQGTSIAIDPQTGAVYVVWRGFTPNAIYLSKSTDGGKTWSKPITVSNSSYYPYDQGATGVSMRTLDFPTVAVSVKERHEPRARRVVAARGASRDDAALHRVPGTTHPEKCDARIVMTTSTNGGPFSTPTVVDGGFQVSALQLDSNGQSIGEPVAHSRGHQIQPSLTFAAGKLLLTWLDSRLDATEGVLQCQNQPAART